MNKPPFLIEKMTRLTLVIVLLSLCACQKPTQLPPVKPTLSSSPTVDYGTNTSTPTQTAATSTPIKITATPTPAPTETPTATPSNNDNVTPFQDPSQPVEVRVADLLGRMSLEEKIGQMAQVEKGSINQPHDITTYFLGSILSGGGGSPGGNNTPPGWMDMVGGFQTRTLNTHLGIPLIYGVDAVHGHGNLYGATIFPHNIGLGATRDPDLVERIGRATAEEMAATGIRWNFAPVVAVVQDIRWGRTYEGYSENTQVVSDLSSAYIRGLQNINGKQDLSNILAVLATPKHFIGDGGTAWCSSTTGNYILDQGDTRMDEATLRKLFLPPYQSAIENGAMSIMVSFSSWNGVKMHAQKYLLTDVLKGELGFKGFIVSDWQAIDQISPNYYQALVSSINAGIDLVMIPYDYKRFTTTITQAVTNKAIPIERIDDAVSRILTVKFKMGLFEKPYTNPGNVDLVGIPEHRELAREAVRKSLVLLKNENGALPISKDTPLIYISGKGADNIGMMCGGWTIEWQGKMGKTEPGTTILIAIRNTVSNTTKMVYSRDGNFENNVDDQGKPVKADVGIVVVGEEPYAEGVGDRADLSLSKTDREVIARVRAASQKLVVVLLSGRPLVITKELPNWDGLVAAWWPGTEGQGIADVLLGDFPFTGKLPYSWPRWNNQLPFNFTNLATEGCASPLFPFGYGLGEAGSEPIMWLDCPGY